MIDEDRLAALEGKTAMLVGWIEDGVFDLSAAFETKVQAFTRRLDSQDAQFDEEKLARQQLGRRVTFMAERELDSANWSARLTWIAIGTSGATTLALWLIVAGIWWALR